MANTPTYSGFRVQTYRLAWVFALLEFAVVILMLMMRQYNTNDILPKIGICLFFAASLFSILCRSIVPFVEAFVGLVFMGAINIAA